MTPRDYKQRPPRSPARKPARQVSALTWFGSGAGVGALLTVAVFLYEPRLPGPGPAASPAPAAAKSRTTPRLEFYQVLPEKEIAVPDTALVEAASRPQAPVDSSAAGSRYLLQVGSFRKLGDADRLKAQLALLGLEASIQTVSIDGTETWHRVRLGPYGEIGKLKAARSRLKQNKLETIVLKLRN